MQNNVKPFDIRARVMYNVDNIYFIMWENIFRERRFIKQTRKIFRTPSLLKLRKFIEKTNMKKRLLIMLLAALCALLTSCGTKNAPTVDTQTDGSTTITDSVTNSDTESDTDTDAESESDTESDTATDTESDTGSGGSYSENELPWL